VGFFYIKKMKEKKTKNVSFFNENAQEKNKPVSNENPIIESKEAEYSKEIDAKIVEKEILNSLANKSTEFVIDIIEPNLWQKITKKTFRTFSIRKITLSRVAAITAILKDLPFVDLTNLDGGELAMAGMDILTEENANKMFRIICIFLEGEEKKEVINFLSKNLDSNDILEYAYNIIKLAGYQNFILTTSLLKANLSMGTAAK